jgi:hypothetical protein
MLLEIYALYCDCEANKKGSIFLLTILVIQTSFFNSKIIKTTLLNVAYYLNLFECLFLPVSISKSAVAPLMKNMFARFQEMKYFSSRIQTSSRNERWLKSGCGWRDLDFEDIERHCWNDCEWRMLLFGHRKNFEDARSEDNIFMASSLYDFAIFFYSN